MRALVGLAMRWKLARVKAGMLLHKAASRLVSLSGNHGRFSPRCMIIY